MRGLTHFKRSSSPSNGMDAPRSAGAPVSSPAAAQRCAEGAGLDSGVLAAAQSAMLSIAAPAAMIADMISTRAAAFDGPSATARIYTRLTDVTHAGSKYMRYMIEQYYGKEPMTKLDKALFSFASYNAGPGRIAQLRKEAAKRGLDPNVWFHNVEYVAAEKIGAETVTYVSNIYKYYIAYQLIMEARAAREEAAEKLKSQSN